MSSRRTRAAALAVTVAVSASTLSACVGASGSSSNFFSFQNDTSLGKLIPLHERKPVRGFSGNLISGGSLSLSAEKRHVTVINFFASNCGPCRIETPQLALLAERDKAVRFVGIDLADEKASAETFLHQSHVHYPVIFDEADRAPLAMDMPARAVPFTVLLDRMQRVAAVYLGALTPQDLIKPLADLQKQP